MVDKRRADLPIRSTIAAMRAGRRLPLPWRPAAIVAAAVVAVTVTVTLAGASVPSGSTQAPVPRLRPPLLSEPTTIAISDTNRRLFLEDGRDYVVKMPSAPFTLAGGISIVGGRNVVLIGGEIYDDTPIAPSESADNAYGLYLENQTGTVHLEGLWIHGRGIGQALVLAQFDGATVQVLNSRLAALHPVGHVHTDGIQSWAGPARLFLSNVTIRTAGVGIQTQPHQFRPVTIDRWEYRRVNVVQMTGHAHALWKSSGQGGWWREIYQDFWVRNIGRQAWPTRRHWMPGGPAAVEGEPVTKGIPPRGDFVQARAVGLVYDPAIFALAPKPKPKPKPKPRP